MLKDSPLHQHFFFFFLISPVHTPFLFPSLSYSISLLQLPLYYKPFSPFQPLIIFHFSYFPLLYIPLLLIRCLFFSPATTTLALHTSLFSPHSSLFSAHPTLSKLFPPTHSKICLLLKPLFTLFLYSSPTFYSFNFLFIINLTLPSPTGYILPHFLLPLLTVLSLPLFALFSLRQFLLSSFLSLQSINFSSLSKPFSSYSYSFKVFLSSSFFCCCLTFH